MPHAIIAGSTGLIGKALAVALAGSDIQVTLLSRRDFEPTHAHQQILKTNFDPLLLPASKHPDDVVYCALGTTIKKAGSQAAFTAVDLDLVVKVANAAHDAGYRTFAVVSSLGTTPTTRNFYLKTKARMEAAVSEVGFDRVIIIRPSLLLGDREEFRFGEKAGEVLSKVISPVLVGRLKRYRPVQASAVARALIQEATGSEPGIHVVESDVI